MKNNRIRSGTAMVMACSALVAACGGGEEAAPDPLAGTSWELQEYADPANPGSMVPVLSSYVPTMDFFTDGTVHGNGGCNNYNGAYSLQKDSLTFGPMASTMMYCGEEPGVMDQETAFLGRLEGAAGFKIEEGELHILNAEGAVLVRLTAIE